MFTLKWDLIDVIIRRRVRDHQETEAEQEKVKRKGREGWDGLNGVMQCKTPTTTFSILLLLLLLLSGEDDAPSP